MVFRVRPGSRAILLLVEVPDGEDFEPSFGVWLFTMNDLEGDGEFTAHAAWNLVKHGGGVTDSKKPEFSANLFLGDVRPGRLDECAPDAFNNALGGLAAGICRDDLDLVC